MSDPEPHSRRYWHFDWRLLLFSGLLLPLLVSLGLWQLDRAAEKERKLEQWQQQSEMLSWSAHLTRGLEEGKPVSLAGRYGELTWLLDNRTREGRVGYEVLTAFYPRTGPPVVVNRGWVPAPRHRDRLPDIITPDGPVELRGRLTEFPEPPVLGGSPSHEPGWPRRVQSLSSGDAEQALGNEPADYIVRLADTEQAGAYRADWAPDTMGPQTHYGYALQWFSLALALVILTVVASYRRTGADNDNDDG